MDRKAFLTNTGILAGMGILAPHWMQATSPELSPTIKPVLIAPQPKLEHGGSMGVRIGVRSAMTGGVYSNVECAVAPLTMGPPPHYHLELDELMYVTEGTAHVLIGEEIVKVEAGGWHLRPRLLKHTFWNAGEGDLRFIDMYFNQPFEEYLEKVFFEFTAERGFPDGSEVKTKEMNKLNDQFGVIFPPSSWDERNAIVKEFGLK